MYESLKVKIIKIRDDTCNITDKGFSAATQLSIKQFIFFFFNDKIEQILSAIEGYRNNNLSNFGNVAEKPNLTYLYAQLCFTALTFRTIIDFFRLLSYADT